MRRGYADTPEGQFHYRTDGEGEPLVLLHATGSSRQFWKLMPLLAREYCVFAPDNLGEGSSDPMSPGVRIEDLARSHIHFMDALGIEKAHVFGIHTGNKTGTMMAAGWPDRVGSFILCGQTHSIQTTREDLLRVMGPRVFPRIKQFEPSADGRHLVQQWAALFSRFSALWWDTNALTGQELTPELLERRKGRVIDLLQEQAEAEKYRAIFEYEPGAHMREVKVKTLVLEIRVPEEANLHPKGPDIQQLIPGSCLVTVENPASGVAVEEVADELASAILDFLHEVRLAEEQGWGGGETL